jgi:hypothetical protein
MAYEEFPNMVYNNSWQCPGGLQGVLTVKLRGNGNAQDDTEVTAGEDSEALILRATSRGRLERDTLMKLLREAADVIEQFSPDLYPKDTEE